MSSGRLCSKSARLLDLDCPLSPDAASGGLCDWGSEQKDVSAVVGSHSRGVSPRTLLHGFLGGLRGGDPGGATHSRGQRDRRNGSRGAVEQHPAPTTGPFCPYDVILFQVRDHARGQFASLSSSLQYRAGHPAQVSHYLRSKIDGIFEFGLPAAFTFRSTSAMLPLIPCKFTSRVLVLVTSTFVAPRMQ
jgi:hypothetical protein